MRFCNIFCHLILNLISTPFLLGKLEKNSHWCLGDSCRVSPKSRSGDGNSSVWCRMTCHPYRSKFCLSAKNRNATKTSKSSCFRMGPRLLKNIRNWISSAILETFQPLNSTAPAGFNLPLAPHCKHPSESYTPSRDTFEIHFVFSAAGAAGGHG